MGLLAFKSPLTTHERAQRRRLMLQDALALLSLFAITVVLGVLTYLLFGSYESHQKELAARWLKRGELALQQGKPTQAIQALRSALAYAPGQRSTEVELAEALASAGYVQEATAYFNTLLEAEPGSGMINLQLARLAAKQGNTAQAFEDYQRAIYGNWEGDGYVRRRQVRLELVNYLINRKMGNQARSELLTASGNAPVQDTATQLEIAKLMETAQDQQDALNLYRAVLQHSPASFDALAGAGRTAFALSRYALARQYLERAEARASATKQPEAVRAEDAAMLHDATRVLALYPSQRLGDRARFERLMTDRSIAQQRLDRCVASTNAGEPAVSGLAAPAATARSSAGPTPANAAPADAGPANQLSPKQPPPNPAAPNLAPLQQLVLRWEREPQPLSFAAVQASPDLMQSEIQLIYDTEQITSQVCGPATGDDALLLKIAQAPDAVEQQ